MVVRFLRGITHQSDFSVDLNIVLAALLGPPFDPLATCFLSLLCLKAVCLVAITSMRRVSELQVLMYTRSFKDKVALRPHPKFLSQFHLNQTICLSLFFPKPQSNADEQHLHSLDVR